ncbi:MAG: adenine phosphoribosyltransferase [Planctomycetota bacterium]
MSINIESHIRDVHDFPKPGIVFKDITPMLANPAALAMAVELMASPFRGQDIHKVCGAESRGFIFGTAIAQSLSAGFVPIRKPGKLPSDTVSMNYELEYGTDQLEVHKDAIQPGERVLMVDDLLATGGTMKACCHMIDDLGGDIVGVTMLIELGFLPGREKLGRFGDITHAVIKY